MLCIIYLINCTNIVNIIEEIFNSQTVTTLLTWQKVINYAIIHCPKIEMIFAEGKFTKKPSIARSIINSFPLFHFKKIHNVVTVCTNYSTHIC